MTISDWKQLRQKPSSNFGLSTGSAQWQIGSAQWQIGYGVGLRIKRSSVRNRPWPLRWVLGQGSLLPLSQGEAFTLVSISYLAILVKYILAKKKKKKKKTLLSNLFSTGTVKPALSDHPTVQEKVVVIDRWSLKQGSLNSGWFLEALLNGGERRGTYAYDQHNDESRRPGASGGFVWWFSRKLALWSLF